MVNLLLIPLLPFAGFLVNASLGRRLTKPVSGAIACGVMIGSFLVSAWAFALIAPGEGRALDQTVFDWITSDKLDIPFRLRLDSLSGVMILIVTGIGSLIHIYSTAYMSEERDSEYARYFSYLNLFAAFMLLLVLAANFVVMFVGWEGVGLCSYLLVGFWYEKKSASDAGKKAFIVNRIGDFGFLLGVIATFVHFGTLDFQNVARSAAQYDREMTFGPMSLITLLLFVGATGKSAQIPLYVWLPDAMEGPTPVSALIHAATMVTAGVYMIARNAVLFQHAPETLTIVAVIGIATAFIAGTIGLVQNDIKRVLAYSTVSQLGYMFLAMGVGAYAAGIFHLYTHAFFKALLFLGAGAVIHALAGEQDLRRMGGLKNRLPLTYWTFVVGALAIAGVPGLAGFFSKDEILYETFAGGHTVLWIVGLFTSLLTAIYMFRVVFLAFHGPSPAASASQAGPTPAASAAEHGAAPAHPEEEEPVAHAASSPHGTPAHVHDAPPAMAVALIVLALGSIFAGYVGVGNRFGHFLAPSFEAGDAGTIRPERGAASEGDAGLEIALMVVSSAVAVGGIVLAAYFFLRNRRAADNLARRFAGAYRLLANKYYVDEAYDAAIVQPIRIVSEEGLWRGLDVRVIDGAVNGVGEMVGGASELLRRLQTGSVRAYAASLFFGVVLILGYYLWK
jgi:NADH-quinone oxidoreductase subunit L